MAAGGGGTAALTPLSRAASSSQLIHILTSEPFLAANTNSPIGSTFSKRADIKSKMSHIFHLLLIKTLTLRST